MNKTVEFSVGEHVDCSELCFKGTTAVIIKIAKNGFGCTIKLDRDGSLHSTSTLNLKKLSK